MQAGAWLSDREQLQVTISVPVRDFENLNWHCDGGVREKSPVKPNKLSWYFEERCKISYPKLQYLYPQ